MLLSSLAEEIRDALEANADVIASALPVECALDPAHCFESRVSGIWVVPMVVEYDIQQSNRREKVKSLIEKPVVSVIISAPLVEFQENDVTTWAKSKATLDLRQKIDRFISTRQWTDKIIDVTPEPPVEVSLNIKWYVSITEYTFEGAVC